MSQTKLFVFDIDDTLTQTAKLHQIAFIAALKKMGIHKMDTNFNEYKHHTDSYIARLIYEKDKKELFDKFKVLEFESILNQFLTTEKIEEITGAKKLINTIQNDDEYGICFATGSLLAPAKYKLDQIGIKNYTPLLEASNSIEKREEIVKSAIINRITFNKLFLLVMVCGI